MDVESVFRATFGIKKEQDIVGLIEAAVNVAGLIVPDKLKKHRSRIVKLLFDEDPTNSTDDLFSDDELGFDSDDDDSDKVIVSSLPKEEKLIRKSLELSDKVDATPPPLRSIMSEKMAEHQDKAVEATKKMVGLKYHEEEAEKKAKKKIERCMDFPENKAAVSFPPKNVRTSQKNFKKHVELSPKDNKLMESTKKMKGQKYHEEEAEEKAKRKIERSMDYFPEPKKHCGEIDRSKAKHPSGNVRQRPRSSMKRMKAKDVKPK